MSEPQDLQICSAHLQSALLHMEARSIPTNPSNIRIWYEYSEGGYQELNDAVDELIQSKIKFDEVICNNLYERFFGELPSQQLREFKDAVQHLASEIGIELANLVPTSSECAKAIASAENALANGCELQALRKITAQLIDESRLVLNQNNHMKGVISGLQTKMSSLEVNLEKAHSEAMTDELTGVANRRAFERKLDQVLSNLTPDRNACLLTMDIDKFKDFNDRHGHLMGDKVLCFVVQMIKKVIKGQDLLARFGGEEFQLLLEDCCLEDAANIAEKIRKTIEAAKLTSGPDRKPMGCVTVSIGVAALTQGEGRNQLINRADKYLYTAKSKGRNRIICE